MKKTIGAALLCGLSLAAVAALLPARAAAQGAPPDLAAVPAAAASAPASPAPAAAAPPRVMEARSNHTDPNRIGLGYVVAVKMENLPAYLASTGTTCESLTLFINDVPVEGLAPDSCDLADGRVRFTLVRDESSAAAWRLLFTEPWEFTNKVSLSVGPKGRLSWPSAVEGLELVILPEFWVYTFFVGLVVAFALLVWLSRRTALLRDRGEGVAEGALAPYSLSRFQLAFWLFLVVAAYVFIWMITGELDTITGAVLALLGIGSGTALGAAIIDQNKEDAATAAGSAARAAAGPPAAAPSAAEAVASTGKKAQTRGFLNDVLSDEKGVSIHRFQLFVWTLVLGIIFCAAVFGTLAMPQFSPTLLGLMGISSGTYLGLKVPEGTPGRRE